VNKSSVGFFTPIAFKTWKKTTPKQRSEILFKIADAIDANKERLAKIETMDNGKSLREALNIDIPSASSQFRYMANCIVAEEGSSNIIDEKFLSIVIREPIGVVGQIVPWNFPFLMGAWKLAPVLAARDCTVFKPSSETSFIATLIAFTLKSVYFLAFLFLSSSMSCLKYLNKFFFSVSIAKNFSLSTSSAFSFTEFFPYSLYELSTATSRTSSS